MMLKYIKRELKLFSKIYSQQYRKPNQCLYVLYELYLCFLNSLKSCFNKIWSFFGGGVTIFLNVILHACFKNGSLSWWPCILNKQKSVIKYKGLFLNCRFCHHAPCTCRNIVLQTMSFSTIFSHVAGIFTCNFPAGSQCTWRKKCTAVWPMCRSPSMTLRCAEWLRSQSLKNWFYFRVDVLASWGTPCSLLELIYIA